MEPPGCSTSRFCPHQDPTFLPFVFCFRLLRFIGFRGFDLNYVLRNWLWFWDPWIGTYCTWKWYSRLPRSSCWEDMIGFFVCFSFLEFWPTSLCELLFLFFILWWSLESNLLCLMSFPLFCFRIWWASSRMLQLKVIVDLCACIICFGENDLFSLSDRIVHPLLWMRKVMPSFGFCTADKT